MIIPIQQEMESQTLVQVDCVSSVDDTLLEVIRLDGDSRQYTVTPITPVMFVPLIKRDDP